jgi:hypothetical protein
VRSRSEGRLSRAAGSGNSTYGCTRRTHRPSRARRRCRLHPARTPAAARAFPAAVLLPIRENGEPAWAARGAKRSTPTCRSARQVRRGGTTPTLPRPPPSLDLFPVSNNLPSDGNAIPAGEGPSQVGPTLPPPEGPLRRRDLHRRVSMNLSDPRCPMPSASRRGNRKQRSEFLSRH